MKRFRFSLQRVLDIRLKREERVRLEMAALEHRRRVEVQRLAVLDRRQHEAEEQVRRHLQRASSPEIIQGGFDYLEALAHEIEAQQRIVDELAEQIAAKRQQLLQATREREVMERLREVKRQAHRRSWLKQEAKQMDEFGTVGFLASARAAVSTEEREGD